MATFAEISDLAEQVWGGTRDTPDMLRLEIGTPGDRSQKVFLRREIMKPDLEFLDISSPIGHVGQVDLPAVVSRVGQMIVGGLGHVGDDAGDGILLLTTRVPTVALDADAREPLMLMIQLIANAADHLEQEFGFPAADLF